MASSERPFSESSPVQGRNGDAAVASGETLNPEGVVGRRPELAQIARLLSAAAAGRSAGLVLEGEPGAGKTTLLDAAHDGARDFTVLRTRGTADEAHLPYAGLLGLLHPLRAGLGTLPETQAASLGAALGWSIASELVDRFLVGAATLTLLAAAGAERPVLVLVDDLQWLDRESRDAILFALRRLGPDPVAFLLATRTSPPNDDPVDGVSSLLVGGLSPLDAATLLPDLAPSVLDRLVRDTAGNPLALLETSRRLDADQRRGIAPIPDPLPGSRRLSDVYRRAVGSLSVRTQQAVLMLAVAGSSAGNEEAVDEALRGAGIEPEQSWREAHDHAVLVRDEGRNAFRHPLVRAAVIDVATPAQRRTAHAALAASPHLGPRERVWHRADATIGTDSDVADAMAALAEEERDRVGYPAASLAAERSARLTPEPELAEQRLAHAADDAWRAGDTARVRDLVAEVLRAGSEEARGQALFTQGMLEQYAGSVPQSVEYLDQAAMLLHDVARTRALTELAMAYFRLSDVDGVARCAVLLDADSRSDDPERRLLAGFTVGVSQMLTGAIQPAMGHLAEVRRLSDDPTLRRDGRAIVLMALAAGFTGEIADAVTIGEARLAELRRRGALGQLVPGLALLAAGKAWLGDHAGAFADAGEAADLAALLGFAADASTAVEMLAWQQASRGWHADAEVSLERARQLVHRAGVTRHAAHHALTSAYCALCRGDPAAVISLLEERLALDGGIGAAGEPLGVAPLLVEAYVVVGKLDEARALTSSFADVTPAGSAPLSLALVLRCQALTAPDDNAAAEIFVAAEAAHTAGLDPFETARTRLLYGGRLRRAGERVAARVQLESARSAFATMDLTHWVEVADAELAATGASRRVRTPSNEPLTSQETRVALLAAEGLANKEIAAAMFLSPKTIERHLSNVFRKRGVRSRTELAAAYARADRH